MMNTGLTKTGRSCSNSPQINHPPWRTSSRIWSSSRYWLFPYGQSYVACASLLSLRLFDAVRQYSFDKSRIRMGLVGKEWQNKVVNELDSSLNRWLDSVPEHRSSSFFLFISESDVSMTVRWDPYRENETFFEQSIVLNCNYYNVQILIHRSFIPSPTEPKEFQFPSVAICANAARSLIHIAERQLQRGAVGGLHHVMVRIFGLDVCAIL